jgi:hypothetical protein
MESGVPLLDDVFGQDWLTPAIAFTVSVIGSFLGLSFAYRARRATGVLGHAGLMACLARWPRSPSPPVQRPLRPPTGLPRLADRSM